MNVRIEKVGGFFTAKKTKTSLIHRHIQSQINKWNLFNGTYQVLSINPHPSTFKYYLSHCKKSHSKFIPHTFQVLITPQITPCLPSLILQSIHLTYNTQYTSTPKIITFMLITLICIQSNCHCTHSVHGIMTHTFITLTDN